MTRPPLHYSPSSACLLDNKILEMSWRMNLITIVSGFGVRMKSSLVMHRGSTTLFSDNVTSRYNTLLETTFVIHSDLPVSQVSWFLQQQLNKQELSLDCH